MQMINRAECHWHKYDNPIWRMDDGLKRESDCAELYQSKHRALTLIKCNDDNICDLQMFKVYI